MLSHLFSSVRRRWGRVSALLLSGLLLAVSAEASPPASGLYGGAESMLHLRTDRSDGRLDGVLYTRARAYRFSGSLPDGETFRARKLFSRNDRNAPWRSFRGALTIRSSEAGALRLSLSGAGASFSSVFRRRFTPRDAFGVLDRFGETYCDGEHLVLLLAEPEPPSSTGWLRRLIRSKRRNLPLLGLYLGPRSWYVFRGRPGPDGVVEALDVQAGSAAGAELTGLRIRAERRDDRLLYTEIRMGTGRELAIPYRSQRNACSRLVTRWTTQRRIPRGALSRPAAPKPRKAKKKAGKGGGDAPPPVRKTKARPVPKAETGGAIG